jgi:hypothetical protein
MHRRRTRRRCWIPALFSPILSRKRGFFLRATTKFRSSGEGFALGSSLVFLRSRHKSGELRPSRYTKFVEYGAEVVFDRLDTNNQVCRYLPVRQSLHGQVGDRLLTGGQPRLGGRAREVSPLGWPQPASGQFGRASVPERRSAELVVALKR